MASPAQLPTSPHARFGSPSSLLLPAAASLGIVLLWLTYLVGAPFFATAGSPDAEPLHIVVPPYDYQPWHTLPIQAGRIKPFETACADAVRQITGKSRFEGQDPVAVVLAWMLAGDADPGTTNWENYPFIFCEHHALRRRIYAHRDVAGQELTGRHISPADLRQSPEFDDLLKSVARARREFRNEAHLHITPEELKAEEVGRRLVQYDAIRGRSSTRLYRNALLGERFLDLQEYADIGDTSPAQALTEQEKKLRTSPDPFRLVALDRVPGSDWFSFGELLAVRDDPGRWRQLMEGRLAESPQLYLRPNCVQSLREFQDRVRSGTANQIVEEIEVRLREQREQKVKQFETAYSTGDVEGANELFSRIVRSATDQTRLQRVRERVRKESTDPEVLRSALVAEMHAILQEEDERMLQRLRQGVALATTRPYEPDSPEFRMLHLDYLESRFPDLHRDSAASQPFPAAEAGRVLAEFDQVREAYRCGDATRFENDSRTLLRTLRDISDWMTIQGLAERTASEEVRVAYDSVCAARRSDAAERVDEANAAFFVAAKRAGLEGEPYPGVTTLPLELLYNRSQPFRWAWLLMLAGAGAFALRLGLGSRFAYVAGFVFYGCSLAAQGFGFFARVSISGRAPVSNMYETVVFVAFMAGIFALVLELIYRRAVIGLAGALVATLGLILADQLPLALDPKIGPLVPVLRSNYWLTVHVLTIVSSYAAATLAWGVGNLSLLLLIFGKGRREDLKTLAQFTYRTVQLTVLLLAAGTFLGGWWAAESWGRFWGWDPKEVGALVALICYVIPLHARYIGWVKDFGLAVAAVLCYAAILLSWYVVNFVLAAGLHSYGFGAGGGQWILWASLLNVEWVLIAALLYRRRTRTQSLAA